MIRRKWSRHWCGNAIEKRNKSTAINYISIPKESGRCYIVNLWCECSLFTERCLWMEQLNWLSSKYAEQSHGPWSMFHGQPINRFFALSTFLIPWIVSGMKRSKWTDRRMDRTCDTVLESKLIQLVRVHWNWQLIWYVLWTRKIFPSIYFSFTKWVDKKLIISSWCLLNPHIQMAISMGFDGEMKKRS